MTEGVIWKQLVSFSIPLLIGNLFQQLYNTVDSIVVGNFVSTQALAAVGSTGPVINTLVGFFMGLSTGASVIISQYYGARDNKNLRLAVHTTMIMTFILAVVFTFVGIAIVPFMLRFMKTPDDVFAESVEYLRIYFAGVSGLMVYNIGSGILRAIGDSRRPLYFLCVSSLINVVLDLLFVLQFNMGIAGVAYATIIAQFVSAILVLIVLSNKSEPYGIVWREMRLSKAILKVIVRVGMPAGLQQAVTSFSNVFVQSILMCLVRPVWRAGLPIPRLISLSCCRCRVWHWRLRHLLGKTSVRTSLTVPKKVCVRLFTLPSARLRCLLSC